METSDLRMTPERETVPDTSEMSESEAYAKALILADEFMPGLKAQGVEMPKAELVAKLMDIILPPKAN